MKRVYLLILTVIFVSALAGCGSSNGAAAKTIVSVTGSFQSVQAGTGPVTLTSNIPVTWALSVANVPCAPGCGTLSSGTAATTSTNYTPPSQPPLNASATITATSTTDSSQTFVFDFEITAPVSVMITNAFTTQLASGPAVQVNASVSNDSAGAGVTWTLTAGGAACSPACGTLVSSAAPSFSAIYTPPSSLPTGSSDSPTITATSVTSTAASASFTFTITSALGLFSGNYTFLLRGYDGNELPMAMAGAVTADGNGNITGGEIDIDDDGGITTIPSPTTGTYSIDASFNGVTRGTITITSYTFPNSTDNIVLKFSLSADGTRGKIVELDGSGYLNAGNLLQQTTSAFSLASIAGSYAFGLDSDAPVGGRIVAAGQFVLAQSGITGGLIDQSKAGNATPIYSDTAISASSVGAPDALGRGTFTMTVQGNGTQYAYYIVNSGQMDLIEIDSGLLYGTAQAGTAFAQQALSPASVNTTSVLQLTGMDVVQGTNNIGPDVIIGVMTITGGNTFTLTFDENDLGSILTSDTVNGGIASFDPTTGRGVVAAGDFVSGFVNSAVFYLYNTGQGFFIDTDPSTSNVPPSQAVTNNAFSGTLTPQTGSPYSSQTLSGNSIIRFGASAIPDIPNLAGAANYNNALGTFTAEGDLTSLNSEGANLPDFMFSGTYSVSDTNLGYGSASLPSPIFGNFSNQQVYPASFYLIGPNQFVLIGIESGAYSGIAFFDPQ